MLSGGEHPNVVQEMMGHSKINVTLDFYSHVLPVICKKRPWVGGARFFPNRLVY